MNMRFIKDTELEVVEAFYDGFDAVEITNEVFRKDEIIDVDVFDQEIKDGKLFIHIEFANGSVIYDVPEDCVEIMGEL